MTEPVAGIALAVVIVGLALSTFVTRTSFLIAGAKLRLGPRVEVALRYAPVCTLAAIIVPDVLIHPPGHVIDCRCSIRGSSARWPRRFGSCWSRNIIGCLTVGMGAYSLARLYL